MREQSKLDKLLQKTYSFENYLDGCGRDLALNLRKAQQLDLVVPSPNTALAVDLLSTGRYTRMPLMLQQLAESATTNSVPMPPLGPEEADPTVERIYSEYRIRFRGSECRRKQAVVKYSNAQCTLEREGMFSVTLVYDFYTWQVLLAVPTVLERFGCSTDGEARTTFFSMLMYAVAIHNTQNKRNIFDVVYDCANLYVGKIIMERLKAQAVDYRALKLIVTDYTYYVSSEPEHMLISCTDVEMDEHNWLVLDIKTFPGFREDDAEYITLRFEMEGSGDISVTTLELPNLICESRITEHRLDQWLDILANRLEKYQLEKLGNSAYVSMNYATGSLNLKGLPVTFTLAESEPLMQCLHVREALMRVGGGEDPCSELSREWLREFWRGRPCMFCPPTGHTEPVEPWDETELSAELIAPLVQDANSAEGLLSEQLRQFVMDFWIYLADKPNAVHGAIAYRANNVFNFESTEDVELYLTAAAHDGHIAERVVLVIKESVLQGTIRLTDDLSHYAAAKNMILGIIHLANKISHLRGFTTEPLAPDHQTLVAFLRGLKLQINYMGVCDCVSQNGIFTRFNSMEAAYAFLNSMKTMGD
ncbi:cloroquine resistance associated Cg2 [Babesia ovata]|uniref:Mediator of RNA polymerase II transcription subunit 14 n=1 Tax=Babesia ovata TaxID=189622 RepID=A0A2H6K844_9APIC|nr:cloroquine resistance associated Cg2 [Babesia ovata]GBE59161.1 cloroquine resistance associated Cg2 [Babesia ovata]